MNSASVRRRIPVLACGIFAREISHVSPEILSRIEVRFLDSMLHMHPETLDRRLGEELAGEAEGPLILLYGDCCPHMEEFASGDGANQGRGRVRTRGINCVEIILGTERFKELRREGAFFFMSEWLARWEEVITHEFGFSDPTLARSFMQESARLLVYIDMGLSPVPTAELERVRLHLGLPLRIERAGMGWLEKALLSCIEELDHEA
jgi:hypothetical protein